VKIGFRGCFQSSVHNILSAVKKCKIKVYTVVILTVVLHGCETGSLTLRGECRLRMFKNKVLRRIYGPTREEIAG
jgi:hypothetical protein